MDSQLQPGDSLSKEELIELTYARLDALLKKLKETKKVLLRDWADLTPGERSAQSRLVKEIEQEIKVVRDEIAMNRLV